jgi:Zn-dependent protease with chaperone function
MTGGEWVTPALAVLLVATFGLTVGGWTRHVHPATGARLLLATSVLTSAALATTLAMLAVPLAGQNDGLADYAHWSEAVFASSSRSGRVVALVAALSLTVVVIRTIREVCRQRRASVSAETFRRTVGATRGDVVITASENPDAMALASGVILLTSGLVRALDAGERRAVLAHERAHLTLGHHRYLRLGSLLAAVNPLLFRVPDTLAYLTERWADEEAARVTSRATTASALERTALLSAHRSVRPLVALHATAVAVELRIRALRASPPAMRWPRLLAPLILVLALIAVTLMVSERTIDVLQLAGVFGDQATSG